MEEFNNLDIKKAAVVGLLLAVVYYFVLYDNGSKVQSQIQAKNNEIQGQKDTLGKIQKAIEDKRKFDQEAEEINTNIEAFMAYFPPEMDKNKFIKSISKAAEENAATVISLKPVAKVPEFPDYPEMAFQFEVEGVYHNLMKFIADLTQLKRAIDFRETKLKVIAQDDVPRIKFSATLIVFGHTAQPYKGGAGG